MSLEPAEQLAHDGANFLMGAGAMRHLTMDTSRVDFSFLSSYTQVN